jgi:hypothetical protein
VCSNKTAGQQELVTPPATRRHPARVDSETARRARRQHGVLTRTQLLDEGLSSPAITHRCQAERLHRIHNGVYGVGYVSPSPLARAMAAVLSCGPNAVLSTDLDLAAAGHVVVHVTWTRLAHEPDREAARLCTVLARRAP